MTSRLLHHARHNLVAYLDLFVALTGTAVAATARPRNSVGTKQLRKRAVTGPARREGADGRHRHLGHQGRPRQHRRRPVPERLTRRRYATVGKISCTGTPVDFICVVDDAGPTTLLSLYAYNVMDLSGLATKPVANVGQDRDSPTAATLDTPFTVDNTHDAFELLWSPGVCNSDSQLAGAAVHYDLPR